MDSRLRGNDTNPVMVLAGLTLNKPPPFAFAKASDGQAGAGAKHEKKIGNRE